MPPALTIGILGMFADSNLGDDACPTALLHHLPRLAPGADFVLFCRFPTVAEKRFAVAAFPVERAARGQVGSWQPSAGLVESFTDEPAAAAEAGWRAWARGIPPLRFVVRAARALGAVLRQLPAEARFLWESYRRLRRVRLLLVAGSNPLFDFFGGFWNYPYRTWKWATLARLAGTRLAFVSVGAGPIISRRSGRLLARVLRGADYVSFRDEGSRRLMAAHGFAGPAHVYPDLAHGLPFTPTVRDRGARLRVGINPMIIYHGVFWPIADRQRYRQYVEHLAELAAMLHHDGFDVFLYGTQKDDAVPAREIQDVIRTAFPAAAVPEYHAPETVEGLIRLCGSADLLVTTRFHGAVFGVMTKRPTLAICYQGKTREVLEAAGLGEFALDLDQAGLGSLRTAFDGLLSRRNEVEAILEKHAGPMRAELADQDARLVALFERGTTPGTPSAHG